MSQFTANDFADATKKKKKPAGAMVGPPTIVPPVMQDWAAQAGGAATATEAPPPGGNPDVESILRKRRLGDLQNRIMLTQSGADQATIDRAQGLREMRFQRDALAGQDAPVQKVQTPSQVVGARASLSGQLGALSDQTQKAAMDEIGKNPDLERSDPARYAQLRSEIERAARMRAMADTKLAPYGEGAGALENPAVTGIIGRQRELAARQQQRRGAYAELDKPYAADSAAGRAQEFAMRDKGRQLQEAAANTAIAQTQQAGAEASVSADPEVIRANLAAARARAAIEARMAGAQGRAGMRDVAYGGAGLGSPEAIAEFNNKAERAISANDPEAFGLAIVPQLEQIAELDPQEADRIARSLLLVSQQSRPGLGSMIGEAITEGINPFGRRGVGVGFKGAAGRAAIDQSLRKFLINP